MPSNTDPADKPDTPRPRSRQSSRPGPTIGDLRQLHNALVTQLPELSANWWRRVRQASREQAVDRLKLLQAEAHNRLDHEERRRRVAHSGLPFDSSFGFRHSSLCRQRFARE